MHNKLQAKFVEIDLMQQQSDNLLAPGSLKTPLEAQIALQASDDDSDTHAIQLHEVPQLTRKKSRYDEEEQKRSKSTAPTNAALTQMLNDQLQFKFEHRKRKLSPGKLLIRHNERIERSEKLKQKLTNDRQQMIEKARSRQSVVQERYVKDLEARRRALQDKLEAAQSRKEVNLASIQEKANVQIQRIEDTIYLNKLTRQNQLLDLESKMNETEQRRKEILDRKVQALKQQHEVVDQKMRAMEEENQSKL